MVIEADLSHASQCVLTHLASAGYRRSAWKNGLGHTDEIAIYPSGASLARGDFLWRLSSARIERSSPFSIFSEHDRVLVVLSGDGVQISHVFEAGEAAETVKLGLLEPYEFPGDIQTSCELVGGPIRDLSVFVRTGVVSQVTEVWRMDSDQESDWQTQAEITFLFVVNGVVAAAGLPKQVVAGDTLRVDGLGFGVKLRAGTGGAVCVRVGLSRV